MREKPMTRESTVLGGVVPFGSGVAWGKALRDLEISFAVGGLRGEPGLSSLSGGVENGDSLASDEGRLGGNGCNDAVSGTGSTAGAMAAGFVGIFGFSALLTGGGGFVLPTRLVAGTAA